MHIAVAVGERLALHNIAAEVVSVPCLEIATESHSEIFSKERTGLRVAIEAGATLSWRHLVGPDGLVFGVDEFGQSASGPELFEHFGLTPTAITNAIKSKIAHGEPI